MRYLIPLLILVLVSAGQFTDYRERPDSDENRYYCRIQPIVITYKGETVWSRISVRSRMNFAKRAFSDVGLEIDVLPERVIEIPKLIVIDKNSDYDTLQKICLSGLKKRQIIMVFTDEVVLPNGEVCGGLTVSPCGAIAISIASKKTVVAHELGHFIGLRHTWEDSLSDTNCKDRYDCDSIENKCNIMGYCTENDQDTCDECKWSKQQIAYMRKEMYSLPSIYDLIHPSD